jgi:uncharacterized membrane-anchored protein
MDKKQFILLMLVPAIVILTLMGVKLFTLSFGKEILLEVEPIDPRDLFRGDYVTLSYKISRIDLNNIPFDTNFSLGETIYAALSKKEKFWTIDSVSHTKPDLTENQVCIKGRVTSSYNNKLSVEWGIESYFVPEGEGRLIERQREGGNVSVIVSVDSTCSSVLKELLINDEPLKIE